MGASEMVVIEGERVVVEDATTWLHEHSDDVATTPRRNLDGDVAAWLVAGTIGTQVIPALLDFAKGLLARGRVSSITVGDVVIANPTPDQVDRLLAQRFSENEPGCDDTNPTR